MPEVGARVFVRRMVDRAVLIEVFTDLRIDRAFVRHKRAGLVDVGHDDRAERL